jgi:hypothetical protein
MRSVRHLKPNASPSYHAALHQDVAKHYIRDPEEMLSFAVDEVNETFRNSGLGNITFRLVYSQLLDYDETVGEQFNHLYRLVDGVSPFENIKKLRNEKGAIRRMRMVYQIANNDELQGRLWWLPAHTLLVEPKDLVQGGVNRYCCQRQCQNYS